MAAPALDVVRCRPWSAGVARLKMPKLLQRGRDNETEIDLERAEYSNTGRSTPMQVARKNIPSDSVGRESHGSIDCAGVLGTRTRPPLAASRAGPARAREWRWANAGATPAHVKRIWPAKYQRFVALKDRHDPENMFRLNPSIKPSREAEATALR
jgi:hypothetical protein